MGCNHGLYLWVASMGCIYGLHCPQGAYPSLISSSLVPENSFRFLSFIYSREGQSGRWNFLELVLSM